MENKEQTSKQLQKDINKALIAEKLAKLYTWHEFEVSHENFEITVDVLSMNLKSEAKIRKFFTEVASGYYGQLNKAPTCITSMVWKMTVN